MSMLQSNACRLCINICNGQRGLYDEDGRRNEVYALTEKYFSPLLLNMECVDHLTVICMECWRHIYEFHTFQESVILAQRMFVVNKRTEAVVKSEVETATGEAEFSKAGQNHHKVAEILTFSQDRVNVSSDQQSEVIVKSEEEFLKYMPISDYVSRNGDVLTKNTASTFSHDIGSVVTDASNDPDQLWEELGDPVGVFAGGEFDNHGNETKEAATLRIQPRQGQTEPNMENPNESIKANTSRTLVGHTKAKSKHAAVSIDNSNDTNKSRAGTSPEKDVKLKFIVSESDLVGSKPKYNRRKRITYKTNLKRPQTVQEYDECIAKWRPILECVICSESYASFSLLQHHFTKQHPAEECYILCCQLKFYHRHEIETHIHFHNEPNAFKCEKCCKCFTDKSSLQVHLQRMHSGKTRSDKLPTNRMKEINNASNNLTSKQGAKPHTCEECGKIYKTLEILQRHRKKVHLGLCKIVKCIICDKACTSSMHLREHMSQHTGRRLYTCQFCPKTFKYRAGLYIHFNKVHGKEWEERKKEKAELKKHKEEKVYKCSICEKAFQRRHSLLEHQARHEGKVLYTCTHCPKTFNYMSNFYTHMKKEHPEEPRKMKKAR